MVEDPTDGLLYLAFPVHSHYQFLFSMSVWHIIFTVTNVYQNDLLLLMKEELKHEQFSKCSKWGRVHYESQDSSTCSVPQEWHFITTEIIINKDVLVKLSTN